MLALGPPTNPDRFKDMKWSVNGLGFGHRTARVWGRNAHRTFVLKPKGRQQCLLAPGRVGVPRRTRSVRDRSRRGPDTGPALPACLRHNGGHVRRHRRGVKAAALLFNIQNYQTKQCIHLNGDVVGTPCEFNHTYSLFRHGSANSIRHYGMESTHYPTHYCLDANGNGDEQPVKINPCNGGNYQKWTRYSDGHVKNWATKKCLDIKSERLFIVYTRNCMPDNQWQKWAFK